LFYGKWLAFSRQTDRIVFVKYIDMLRDIDTELHRLESAMCLKRRLLAQLRSNSVAKVAQSARFTDERRSYYLREQYLSEYCLQELQAINDHIDLEVISLLGYAERETM